MKEILKGINFSQIKNQENVYLLTDDPSINIENNDKPKYVGYDHIGELYSGLDEWYKLNEEYLLLASKMKELFGNDKLLLDLGCGDGLISVPFAQQDFSVIAGDISLRMLKLLQKKAELNHVSLEKTYVCRLNAYNIPLFDESVDLVTCREVLHLVSEPTKVMDEIYRVLKKGGKYLLLTNSPHYKSKEITFDYHLDYEITDYFQNTYWNELKKHTLPNQIKYSWNFNQEAAADEYFSKKEQLLIKEGGEMVEGSLKYFFDRYEGKAFSNLTSIDTSIHQTVFNKTLKLCKDKYGNDFIEQVKSKYLTEDLYVTVYTK